METQVEDTFEKHQLQFDWSLLKYTPYVSTEKYFELLKIQKGLCAICHKLPRDKRKGKLKKLYVDHCHKTNKIRGLLCMQCNVLLGHAKDNINILQSAIEYLEKE